MKKYLVILNILFCLLLMIYPSITTAEENKNILTFEELSIKVMPEFAYHPNDEKKEHPPLLIGYQGTMLNQTDQPQKGQIEIPLPMDEKNFRVGYVADYSSDLSKVYEIEYTIDEDKGTISWTTSEEIQPNEVYKFVVEYYTDKLTVDKEKKSLDYQFKSFADISLFNVSFIQPLMAENIVLDPEPEKKQTHADEEGIFSYNFQGLKAGDSKSFSMKYERSETKPTVEFVDDEPVQNKETKNDLNMLEIAAFSVIGLIAIGGMIILVKRRKK
ncbi:hypothetical protein [Neobacillus sp. FSL H8-0543]|uniref:hypothetical protein n=1 Tax=Neobacillus sp. FSL H8-0543 TaxID=2954672 RepID=UPI0031584C23